MGIEDEKLDMERKANLQMAVSFIEGSFSDVKPLFDGITTDLKEKESVKITGAVLGKIAKFIDALQNNLGKIEDSFSTKDYSLKKDVEEDVTDFRVDLAEMVESLSVLKENTVLDEEYLRELRNILNMYIYRR